MSAAKEIFERLVSSGMEVAEALSLLSRHAAESAPPVTPKSSAAAHAAESAPPVTPKSSAAARQKRYRDRNESVTKRNADERNETVTNRNESVTRDAPIYISNSNSKKERKIDICDRNALRLQLADDQEAKEIARQRGLDIEEVAAIYLDHVEGKAKPYAGGFRNFLRNHRTTERKTVPQPGDQPTVGDFERAVALFIKDNSKWGNRMGPEPGMGGCRCPPEILVKYGIDPKTGLRMQ